MKKVILISLFLILCIQSRAQYQLVASFNPSASVGQFKGLNHVIDRYNETRQGQNGAAILSRNMRNITVMASLGWRLGIGVPFSDDGGIFFSMNRTGRRAHTYSQGKDINGKMYQRDLRFTANSFNLESSLFFGGSSSGGMLSAGGSVDFVSHKAYTRLDDASYKEVMDELNVGISLFIQGDVYVYDNISVGLRPSYQFIPLTTSYSDLNDAINPATSQFDDRDDISSTGSNFTLSLMLNFVVGSD